MAGFVKKCGKQNYNEMIEILKRGDSPCCQVPMYLLREDQSLRSSGRVVRHLKFEFDLIWFFRGFLVSLSQFVLSLLFVWILELLGFGAYNPDLAQLTAMINRFDHHSNKIKVLHCY